MDLQIIKENLMIKQSLGQTRKNITMQQDYILPDIKPDVISVLCSNGNVYVTKREMINNKAKLDGGVNLFITYLANNGENRVLNTEVIFSELIDTDVNESDCDVLENATIKTIDVKILNERKVSIKVLLDVEIKIFKKMNVELLNNIENITGLQKLEKEVQIKNLVGEGCTKSSIKENVKIDDVDDISEILKLDVKLKNIENKISYNKVLVKADCRLQAVYLTEDNRVCSCNQDVPIMGFIDVMNVDESNVCDTNFRVKNMLVKPNPKEEHSIYVEIEFDIFSDVYENRTVNLIEDIYGLKEDINYTVRKANILSGQDEIINTVSASEKVLIDNINQIYDVDTKADLINKTKSNGIVKFDGEVQVRYLYSSFENQNINAKEVKLGFNFEVPEESCENIKLEIVDDSSFIVLPDSTVDTRININVIKRASNGAEVNIIDDVEVNEEIQDDGYSMIIYFVQKGDSLWKIAKKFKSTVEEIARVNEIENESQIDFGQRLYIPRAV